MFAHTISLGLGTMSNYFIMSHSDNGNNIGVTLNNNGKAQEIQCQYDQNKSGYLNTLPLDGSQSVVSPIVSSDQLSRLSIFRNVFWKPQFLEESTIPKITGCHEIFRIMGKRVLLFKYAHKKRKNLLFRPSLIKYSLSPTSNFGMSLGESRSLEKKRKICLYAS